VPAPASATQAAVSGAPAPTADPLAATASLEALESQICQLAGHLAAATCRFLVLLAEFDARRGWAAWDMPSCTAWLSWKCQLSASTAREHVRVARALASLPVIQAEFAAGRLSFAKVRALTRIADAESDADLAEMAGPMTANQLDKFARAHRTVTRNMDEQARIQRRLNWRHEDDGSLSLSVRLPPEDGAALLGALRAVTQDAAAGDHGDDHGDDHESASAEAPPGGPAASKQRAGASAEARPTSTSLADALVHIAEAFLAGKTRDAQNADVYQIIIHATPDALIRDDALDGTVPAASATAASTATLAGRRHPAGSYAPGGQTIRCHVEDGPAISRQALQRIACDAVWSWISHNEKGEVLNVGRRRREPTPAIRRALRERDKCRCRFPGCHRRTTQAHHIQWWIYDGETSLGNLISLCGYHHRLIHQHGYQIGTPTPGVFVFFRPDGQQIPDSPPPPEPNGQLHEQHDAEITPDTIVPPWYGERLDLDYAVAVLFGNQEVRQQRRQHQEAAAAAALAA
jgi:hypothetical protein